jgi:hypothetical protein
MQSAFWVQNENEERVELALFEREKSKAVVSFGKSSAVLFSTIPDLYPMIVKC